MIDYFRKNQQTQGRLNKGKQLRVPQTATELVTFAIALAHQQLIEELLLFFHLYLGVEVTCLEAGLCNTSTWKYREKGHKGKKDVHAYT